MRDLLRFGVRSTAGREGGASTMSGPGHMVPDYESMLQQGLKKIKETCLERLKDLAPGDRE